MPPNFTGSAPVAVTQLHSGGAAENSGMVVGDIFVKFLGEPAHNLTQKEIVSKFLAEGDKPIPLVVKNVS